MPSSATATVTAAAAAALQKVAAADPPKAKTESAESRIIRLSIRYGEDAAKLAEEFFRELKIPAEARVILGPWIRDRILHTLREGAMAEWAKARSDARVTQGRENAEGHTTAHFKSGRNPAIAGDLAFLDCRIIMAGAPRGFKLYRHLTVDEHKARSAMHTRSASSALHSARSHEWSAAVISRHPGAKCLNDIAAEILASELPREGIRP